MVSLFFLKNVACLKRDRTAFSRRHYTFARERSIAATSKIRADVFLRTDSTFNVTSHRFVFPIGACEDSLKEVQRRGQYCCSDATRFEHRRDERTEKLHRSRIIAGSYRRPAATRSSNSRYSRASDSRLAVFKDTGRGGADVLRGRPRGRPGGRDGTIEDRARRALRIRSDTCEYTLVISKV